MPIFTFVLNHSRSLFADLRVARVMSYIWPRIAYSELRASAVAALMVSKIELSESVHSLRVTFWIWLSISR